jgi:O-antigen ligase
VNAQSKKFDFRPALYWTAACAASLGIAYGLATKTFWVVAALVGLLMILITKRKMVWGLIVILFLPLIGELYRLPFGADNGTLISDIAIAVVVAVWIIGKIRQNKPFPKNNFNKPLLIFCAIAVCSLLASLTFLKIGDVAVSSLYLVRFFEYAMLGIITLDVVQTEKDRLLLIKTIIFMGVLIAIAGFIQLVIYPDLGNLVEYGWDPHQNRLVSTWLDPNFIGGFLSYIIAILTGITLYSKDLTKKIGLIAIIAVLAAALFLTYSRSGYLAAAAALGVIGIVKSRKLLIGCIVIFLLALSFLPRAQQRLTQLTNSAGALITNTSDSTDPTAALRLISWNQTLQLIEQRPLLGNGYNTLKYVKFNEGFVDDTAVHSASGSDSSILTILATTGILGLIPFIMLYWNALLLAWKNFRNKKPAPPTGPASATSTALSRGYGLGIFAGICGLLVHSIFVNSLLFPQIMIFFWISVGLNRSAAEVAAAPTRPKPKGGVPSSSGCGHCNNVATATPLCRKARTTRAPQRPGQALS